MANAILFCVLPGRAGRDSHGSRRRPGHPVMRARGSIDKPASRPPDGPISLLHPTYFHPLGCGRPASIRSYHGYARISQGACTAALCATLFLIATTACLQ